MSSPPLNFYLVGLSTTVTPGTAASFFGINNTSNFADYSANVICRMKLSVAQNMFQFWSKSADLSSNSIADLVFRTMYDPSAGFNINDASATPMSLDFTKGSIVTWSDPSNAYINFFTSNNSSYQTLFPYDYLRYLSWVIFNNANLTTQFLNSTAVMSSVDSNSNLALNNTLKGLSAYSNPSFQYNYTNIPVDPTSFFLTELPPVNANSNPSSQIFQQIRNTASNRITSINPATSKIANAPTSSYPNGAWYKMPFSAGDSIYFLLTVNTPINQKSSNGTTNITPNSRIYRFRMYIMDDSVLSLQTQDNISNNITFGSFNIYPTPNSLVGAGYSYADPSPNTIDPNDIQEPGP
jgi:hypothetical protein